MSPTNRGAAGVPAARQAALALAACGSRYRPRGRAGQRRPRRPRTHVVTLQGLRPSIPSTGAVNAGKA